MAFSISDQLGSDLDIFISLPFPMLGIHVATAGGVLPERFMEFDNQLNQNAATFTQLARQYQYEINPNLNEIIQFQSAFHRELYIEDFVDKAQKGFISFDKTDINNPYDKSYHIVAYPVCYISSIKKITEFSLEQTPYDNNIFNNALNSLNILGRINLFENI